MSRHFTAHQPETNDVVPAQHEEEPVRFSLGWDDDDDIDEFGDFSNVLFHKVPSNEIVYDETPRLPKFVGGYLLGDTLGEGSYARVKEALDTATIRRAAVKIMKKKKLRKIPSGEENMKREIALLQKLSKTPHPNVIELFDVQCKVEKEKTYLFMTFCCCSLQDMLEGAPGKKFPVWQAHKYITETLHGLSFLHCKHIIHKDIKPANLLLDPSHTVKICDFGVAEELDPYSYSDSVRGSQGAPMFVAPEIAIGMDTVSGRKLDVWSAGVSLFNFVTGTYPFNADNVFKLFKRIEEGQFTIPTDLPEPLQDLLGYMLKYKYEERYCIEECLNHRWILRKQSRSLDEVAMPSKVAQESTLIQYLEELHVEEPEHCHHHDDPTTSRSLRSSADDVLSNSGGDTTRSQSGPPKSASRHCRQQ